MQQEHHAQGRDGASRSLLSKPSTQLLLAVCAVGVVGVWLAGFIHDATGSYDAAFFVIMLFCFLAGTLVLLVNEKEVRGGLAGGSSS